MIQSDAFRRDTRGTFVRNGDPNRYPAGDRSRPCVAWSRIGSRGSLLSWTVQTGKTVAQYGICAIANARLIRQTPGGMSKLLLAILIIGNISAGFEVATDYDETRGGLGSLTSATDIQSGLADEGDEPDELTNCDHCCHGAAHLVGIIGSCLILPYVRASSGVVNSVTPYQLSGRSPPTPPPNA